MSIRSDEQNIIAARNRTIEELREYLAKALRSICTTDSGDHWHVGTHDDCWICDARKLLEANDG